MPLAISGAWLLVYMPYVNVGHECDSVYIPTPQSVLK